VSLLGSVSLRLHLKLNTTAISQEPVSLPFSVPIHDGGYDAEQVRNGDCTKQDYNRAAAFINNNTSATLKDPSVYVVGTSNTTWPFGKLSASIEKSCFI